MTPQSITNDAALYIMREADCEHLFDPEYHYTIETRQGRECLNTMGSNEPILANFGAESWLESVENVKAVLWCDIDDINPYHELCKEAIELFGRMGREFTGGKGGAFRFVANWLKEKTEYLERSQE